MPGRQAWKIAHQSYDDKLKLVEYFNIVFKNVGNVEKNHFQQ